MHLYDLIGGKCKIRKRSSPSASSHSSAPQSYRFKKSIVINRRAAGVGAATPSLPRWKASPRSSSSILRIPQSPVPTPRHSGSGRRKQQEPVSARKLAASLWGMNSPGFRDDDEMVRRSRKGSRSKERLQSDYLPPRLSDPSHNSVSISELFDVSVSNYGRHSMMGLHRIRGFDSTSDASFKQTETRPRRVTPTDSIFEVNSHLRDLRNGLTTSKELLKILSKMWSSEEHYLSGKSIITALCTEFERASDHVDHLIQEKYSSHKEINNLKKNFAEEKAAWKKKVHERVDASFKSILNDLDIERKLRKRSESLSKTLSKELSETKATLSDVMGQLENEKRVREIMERVSDELARGIGEDKALVEQLKKETTMVREEVEKEREMLHLADVLREERVQMKLLEAKYHFEEKNAVVDKLRSDLEEFLKSKEAIDTKLDSHNPAWNIEVGNNLTMSGHQNGEMGEEKSRLEYVKGCKVLKHDVDSSESDLHSIELNRVDNNSNRVWKTQDDQRPVDKGTKVKKSTSGNMTRGRKFIERCSLNGTGGDSDTKFINNAHAKHSEVEKQRSRSIKELKDYISSDSRLASTHHYSSPTKVWAG